MTSQHNYHLSQQRGTVVRRAYRRGRINDGHLHKNNRFDSIISHAHICLYACPNDVSHGLLPTNCVPSLSHICIHRHTPLIQRRRSKGANLSLQLYPHHLTGCADNTSTVKGNSSNYRYSIISLRFIEIEEERLIGSQFAGVDAQKFRILFVR